MAKSTAATIRRNNEYRHANNVTQDRCKHCGSFVSKPPAEHGRVTYVCGSCDRAILEYVPQNKSAKS